MNQWSISCGIIWCNQQGENKTKQEIIIIERNAEEPYDWANIISLLK